MATYQDLITQIRAEAIDFSIKRWETSDGDGSSSVFPVKNPKISDVANTLTVKVGGIVKTENTHFTVNRDYGQIVFTTGNIPPVGNDNVDIQYESVNVLDADWVTIINDILYQKRKKLWLEFDVTQLAFLIAFQEVYSLSTFAADVIALNNIEYRVVSNNTTSPWISIASITNIKFFRTLQNIQFHPPSNTGGWDVRIKGLRAFARGTVIGSTLEPTSEYWNLIKKFAIAEYLRREAMRRMKEVGAVTKEKAFEPIDGILKMADFYEKDGEKLLKELKLPRPPKKISYLVE